MSLLIDDRVGSKHLYTPLSSLCRSVELTRLQSGDCSWVGNGPDGPVSVGVELKKIHDFIASCDEGRLSGTQLVAMANHYEYGYLVVEGLYKPDDTDTLLVYRRGAWVELTHGKRRYVAKQINKFINTLAVKCGMIAWRTGGQVETALLISDWYHWWQEPWDSHTSYLNKTKRASTLTMSGQKASRLSCMLQELDGVGRPRAEAIAKVYPAMFDLVGVDEQDLAGIAYGKRKDGAVLHVGQLTAQRILRQLKEG